MNKNEQWEYEVVTLKDTPDFDLVTFLNEKGQLGWELITVSPQGRVFVFKRKK
jgi:hypothetical protein